MTTEERPEATCHLSGHPDGWHHHLPTTGESKFERRTSPHGWDTCNGGCVQEAFYKDPHRILVIEFDNNADMIKVRKMIHAVGLGQRDVPFADTTGDRLSSVVRSQENFRTVTAILNQVSADAKVAEQEWKMRRAELQRLKTEGL